MTRIPPGRRPSDNASLPRDAYVTHCAFTANRNSCDSHYCDRRCLYAGNDSAYVGLAFNPAGTSRQTPYTFFNLARCSWQRWKEFLLLRWSTKRTNVAAVTRRRTEDYLHQRSPHHGAGDLRNYAVHGHDQFALSRPDRFSRRSAG